MTDHPTTEHDQRPPQGGLPFEPASIRRIREFLEFAHASGEEAGAAEYVGGRLMMASILERLQQEKDA